MQQAWCLYLLALFVWLYQLPFHILLLALVLGIYWPRRKEFPNASHKSFVIVVPAHNEELHISKTIKNLQNLDYAKELFEILVVADNCEDKTAALARELGVTVLERQDKVRRSKGFALEYAFQQLQKRSKNPDAIIVIDADTEVDTQLLRAFAGRLNVGQEWIQAYYSVSNAEESPRTRMMTYAFALFNGTWLWGQDRLGLGCAFRGNGMCLAWTALQRVPWQAYGLAEDLEFSWYLRSLGERVYFAPEVSVYGEILAERNKAAETQQLRWEHGRKQLRERYSLKLNEFPLLIWQRYLLSADLFMPALSRYVSVLALYLLLAAGFYWLSPEGSKAAYQLLAILTIVTLSCFGLYLLSPFLRLRLPLRYAWTLGAAPFYMIWKIRLLKAKAPTSWTRTDRGKPGARV